LEFSFKRKYYQILNSSVFIYLNSTSILEEADTKTLPNAESLCQQCVLLKQSGKTILACQILCILIILNINAVVVPSLENNANQAMRIS